jgi:hypothetical protein
MTDMVDAYWFGAREENGLVYTGHGDEPGWRDGEERTVARPEDVCMCEWGYHAADSWLIALPWAPGPIACRVRLEVAHRENGKLVGPRRLLVAHVDASPELRLFAVDCAERILQRERSAGRELERASWKVVEASRRYARGEIGTTELERAAAEAEATAYASCGFESYAAYSAFYTAYPNPVKAAKNAAYSARVGVYAPYVAAPDAGIRDPAAYATAIMMARAGGAEEHEWQSRRLDYWMEQAFARKEEGAGG